MIKSSHRNDQQLMIIDRKIKEQDQFHITTEMQKEKREKLSASNGNSGD